MLLFSFHQKILLVFDVLQAFVKGVNGALYGILLLASTLIVQKKRKLQVSNRELVCTCFGDTANFIKGDGARIAGRVLEARSIASVFIGNKGVGTVRLGLTAIMDDSALWTINLNPAKKQTYFNEIFEKRTVTLMASWSVWNWIPPEAFLSRSFQKQNERPEPKFIRSA